MRMRRLTVDRVNKAVERLELPPAVYKTCPFTPRELVETGLRQWLRCCGAALRDGRTIGMPSYAVDEAWHGLILCTVPYERFCRNAYGRFLHHYPEGGDVGGDDKARDSMHDQLGRTVVAWSMVAQPGEQCVLWDIDTEVGVADPWGISAQRVAEVEEGIRSLQEASR